MALYFGRSGSITQSLSTSSNTITSTPKLGANNASEDSSNEALKIEKPFLSKKEVMQVLGVKSTAFGYYLRLGRIPKGRRLYFGDKRHYWRSQVVMELLKRMTALIAP